MSNWLAGGLQQVAGVGSKGLIHGQEGAREAAVRRPPLAGNPWAEQGGCRHQARAQAGEAPVKGAQRLSEIPARRHTYTLMEWWVAWLNITTCSQEPQKKEKKLKSKPNCKTGISGNQWWKFGMSLFVNTYQAWICGPWVLTGHQKVGS